MRQRVGEGAAAVVLLHGPVGAGKSTLARAIVRAFPRFWHISTAEIKHELGLRAAPHHLRDASYQLLADRLGMALQKDESGLADGGFAHRRWREPIYALAARYSANLFIVMCVCDRRDVAKQRIEARARRDPASPYSEANDITFWNSERLRVEQVVADEFPDKTTLFVVDTPRNFARQLDISPAPSCEAAREFHRFLVDYVRGPFLSDEPELLSTRQQR